MGQHTNKGVFVLFIPVLHFRAKPSTLPVKGMQPKDASLIERAQEDSSAYDAVYRAYHDAVYRYFWYRVGRDDDLADDLMQETFLRGFRELHRFRVRGTSYRTYLLTIAHNLLVSYYRKTQPQTLKEADRVSVESQHEIERRVDAGKLWRDLKVLKERERDVLLLRYQDEQSIAAISKIMRRSPNAVKLLLGRARKKLQAYETIPTIVQPPDIHRRSSRLRLSSADPSSRNRATRARTRRKRK